MTPFLKRIAITASVFTLIALASPLHAFAHEVYVLTPAQIQQAIATPSFNEVAVAWQDFYRFAFWGFITLLTIFVVFFISISRRLERLLDPLLARLKPYAPLVARITVGVAFLAAAYYAASYGPELPLASSFGAFAPLMRIGLVIIGLCIIAGTYARTAAIAALLMFLVAVWYHGWYMLTYTNYLGEILVLILIGAHHGLSKGSRSARGFLVLLSKRLTPYGFLILRTCFGTSLLYASFYAKIIHNNLALMVAQSPLAGHMASIAHALGLEPHFLVLGAAIIEIVIGLFFVLGIEIRFTSLFLLFWLSLSLLYFGEVVWPHLILIGIPIAFIFYGYDRYSLEGWLFKRRGREPVL